MTHQELNGLLFGEYIPSISDPLNSLVQAGFRHFMPIEFEGFCLKIFESLGFSGSLTPNSGDEGIDIIAKAPSGLIVIQCKKYDDSSTVSAAQKREFYGAHIHAKASRGYFVTTATFSNQASTFSASHSEITLVDGDRLRHLFLLSILSSQDEFGKIDQFKIHVDESELGDEYRSQVRDLRREFQREFDKLTESFRRRRMDT